MKRVRLGFIGCGRVSANHFSALKGLQDQIELVAVCDHSQIKADVVAGEFGAKGYSDIETMLRSEKFDVVSIATPNGYHAQHALLCAEHGVDVLCEKPMSVSAEDAKSIRDSFKAKGLNFFLIHQNRYNDTIINIKKALDEGRFGKLYMMTSNVFWTRNQDYYDKQPWHGKLDLDGGAYMTQASHYVDMLAWFAGSDVDQVFATFGTLARNIETEDTGSVVFRWKNGIIGNLNVTVLTYPKNLEGSITMIGEKGTVKVGGVALNEILHWEFEEKREEDEAIIRTNYKTDSVYGFGHARVYQKIADYYLRGQNNGLIMVDEAFKDFAILRAIIDSSHANKPIIL